MQNSKENGNVQRASINEIMVRIQPHSPRPSLLPSGSENTKFFLKMILFTILGQTVKSKKYKRKNIVIYVDTEN